jgi:hypothetical protein
MADIGSMFDSAPSNSEGGSKTDERKMDVVPDGSYDVEVTDFSVFVSKKGDTFISWWFEVMSGQYSGAQLQRFTGVGPKTFSFIKTTVKTVTGSIPEWGAMFVDGRTGPIRNEIIGKAVQITQKSRDYQGKAYVNIYVDKVINNPSNPSPESPAEAFDEADVDNLF